MPALQKCILMLRSLNKFILLIFITTALFSSCSVGTSVKKTDYLLGTIVSITIYEGNNCEEIIDECFENIREFESKVSSTDINSTISNLNNSAYNNDVRVDSEIFNLISDSLLLCEESNGAFDIGLGKLIDIWGIGNGTVTVPDMNILEQYIGFVGYEHIVLNYEQATIRYDDERVSINLGACAKGYALDKAVAFLKDKGVTSAILDFGGSIYTIGNKNGDGFDIGIANPAKSGIGGNISGISDISVVTSGDYQRYFEQDGKRYHHILDSRTAFPSESGVRSITVVCDNSFKADCLSTAAFVLGPQKGIELLNKMDCDYIFFTDSDTIVSDRLKDNFCLIYDK